MHRQVGTQVGTFSGFHNFGILHRNSKVHGVLLALAQQIEVKFLFNLLLTGNLGYCLSLRRHSRNLPLSTCLLLSGVTQLHLERINEVIN